LRSVWSLFRISIWIRFSSLVIPKAVTAIVGICIVLSFQS